jgi:hypothetical protein
MESISQKKRGFATDIKYKDILYALKLPPQPTPSQNPTLTVPEFSWIAILTLSVSMLAVVAVAIVVVSGLLVCHKRETKR